jgi:hypothetical protein
MTKASASCFLENLRVFEDGVCALVGCLLGSVGGGVIVAGGVPTARAGFLFALGRSSGIHRAAASALSSGRLLKAIAAPGAPLWTALTTASNTSRP